MLDDRPDLLAALLLGLAAFAFAELGRGILSGRHLFTEYGRYSRPKASAACSSPVRS